MELTAIEPYYRAGTATFSTTTTVTGQGTQWLANVMPGDQIFNRIGQMGVVANVVSNTQITLVAAWAGTAQTAQAYTIYRVPDSSRIEQFSQRLLNLMLSSNLPAFGELPLAANTLPYGSGPGALSLTPLTAFARTLLDDANVLAALGTLGPVHGGVAPPPGSAGVGLSDGNFNSLVVPGVYTIAGNWSNGPGGDAPHTGILMVLARSFNNGYHHIYFWQGGNISKRTTQTSGGLSGWTGWEYLPRTVGMNTFTATQNIESSSYITWRLIRGAVDARLEAAAESGVVGTISNHPFWIRTNNAARLAVSPEGHVSIGTLEPIFPAEGSTTGHTLFSNGRAVRRASGFNPFSHVRLGNNGTIEDFYRDSTQVGWISVSETTTSYNTTSDHRLKEDVEPLVTFSLGEDDFGELGDALLRMLAYRPVRFRWKATGEMDHGFIAHELQSVAPHAVSGEKDETREIGIVTIPQRVEQIEDPETGETVDRIVPEQAIPDAHRDDAPEGATFTPTHDEPAYQGVDPSKLIADLTAAVQELTVLVLEQQRQIDALQDACA